MLYAVGVFVPDPFIYLRIAGRAHIVLSDLELDRARQQVTHCRVLSLARTVRQLQREGVKKAGFARVIQHLLRERRLKKVFVPASFPHGLARQLRDLGMKVRVKEGPFFPERELKVANQVKKISAALLMAEVGLAEAIFLDEMPIIPIYHYTRVFLIQPSVRGWNPTILDHHPYQHVWLEPVR